MKLPLPLLGLLFAVSACGPAKSAENATTRAVVLSMTTVVKQVAIQCTLDLNAAVATKDQSKIVAATATAEKCDVLVTDASAALLTASDVIDAKTSGDVPCLLHRVSLALQDVGPVLSTNSKVLSWAITAADSLGGCKP